MTNVALIPTTSYADAVRAITQAKEQLAHEKESTPTTAAAATTAAPAGPVSIASSEDGDDEDYDASSTVTDTETDISSTVPELEGQTQQGQQQQSSTAPAETVAGGAAGHTRSRHNVNSIAEDVFGKKVPFGRFAASWLSRKTMGLPGFGTVDQDTTEVLLNHNTSTEGQEQGQNLSPGQSQEKQKNQDEEKEQGAERVKSDQTVELLPKLLRYTKLLFSSQNFFFAYDYDLTRQIGTQEPCNGYRPLHTVVDPLYFWNRHLTSPFIDIDAHNYVLPLLQGFVGQREFTVAGPEKSQSEQTEECEQSKSRILDKTDAEAVEAETHKKDYLLTLISRRSVKRPGLRYLRRGVDDDGNTANTVETEQILSVPGWDPAKNFYTYLQVRGSIPLYFSQSPYAFKPVPVLHHSTNTNQIAFERHFREMRRRYGKIQAVSLIDRQAGELKVGEQYERYAQLLNEAGGIDGTPLGMEWFDFHNECRGMKFENVSRLVDRIQTTLQDYGYTTVQDNQVRQGQTGIVRTNCMDCLDRTGVAQSAFGQWALEQQLRHEGSEIDFSGNASATQWFNTLWADNGDAISKQYSSTAALKGDYTRTRKRDYRGALNDLGLTLSRYFNNIVNDYFSQACIDYLLGNVSTQVFSEFAIEMQTADPGISVQKLRQNAIDTSCRIVISEQSEEFLGGWTMLTPRQSNTLRTLPFEESVLLLTDAAVYSCRFDWDTDKVTSFERIELPSISRITYGTYITSVLTDSQVDERSNVGLVVVYDEGEDGENIRRAQNTRTLQSDMDSAPQDQGQGQAQAQAQAQDKDKKPNEWDVIASWFTPKQPTTRFLALKALPLSNSVTQSFYRTHHHGNSSVTTTVTETDWVRCICEEIERAVVASTDSRDKIQEKEKQTGSIVEEGPIVSLDEAKKRTGFLEHWIYDLKKFVWA